MPAKSLHKVQKHVIQRKGKNPALHENSRDSQRLRRASGRNDKQVKAASVREKQRLPYVARVAFFRSLAESRDEVLQESEVRSAVLSYVSRHDEEIAQHEAERRPGRPTTTRYDLLVQAKAQEYAEYASGFWMPDLQDRSNLAALRDWLNDWTSLNKLKFCRIIKDGPVQPSSFPPKGLS